jgi:hypothetical protein
MGVDAPKVDFQTAAQKVKETPNNSEVVAQAFGLAADSTRNAFKTFAIRQDSALRELDRFLQLHDEELQMLWWLIGGRSFAMDCAFEAVAVDAQPLVFAKELAKETVVLPGPRSIKPLLTRAGVNDTKKMTVGAAVNVLPAMWMTALVQDVEPSPVRSLCISPSSARSRPVAARPGFRTGQQWSV